MFQRKEQSAQIGIPVDRSINPLTLLIAVAAFSGLALTLVETGLLVSTTALVLSVVASVTACLVMIVQTAVSSGGFTSNRINDPRSGLSTEMSAHQIVAAIPDPALLLDGSATIVFHNIAAETLFGKSLTGLALEHVSRDPELLRAVEDAMRRGDRAVARFEDRSGVERQLMATVSPLGTDENARTGVVLITIRDLSQQHRMLEMRSDFIAHASHELRTPLASVRGFIETLQGPARNDEGARTRFLGIMAAQAERMTRLIDDLLLLSRVEEKAYLTPTGVVDLDEVMADVERTLLPIADERKISLSLPDAARAVKVIGERDELYQVFQNLIENAIKYGRDGGSVAVTREAQAARGGQSRQVVVTIADDGPGIAPEHLPRLTERFYRVSADQSRKVGGTGLGLAIVKHVVNRHRGELEITSHIGQGTTARVTLPAAA